MTAASPSTEGSVPAVREEPPPAEVVPISLPQLPGCENCGAAVPEHYCTRCGQRLEPHIHSLWHFISEAIEGLTHADSRLWQTLLPLLVRPGHLTREFLAGRRVRYLPPFRLYLVISLLFFLFLGSHVNVVFVGVGSEDAQVPAAAPVAKAEGASGEGVTLATPQERTELICKGVRYTGPWAETIQPKWVAGCTKTMADNGEALGRAFLRYVPHAIFVLVPVLALVMKGLYRRPKRYYVEHLLFFIHNHAFVFLLLGLSTLLTRLIPVEWLSGLTSLAVLVYIPYYFYRAMRSVYGESGRRTVAKLSVLAVAYLVSGVLLLAATSFYSLMTL